MESVINTFQITKNSGLLFHEISHFIFVLPFLFILWKKTRNFGLIIVCLFAAYLLDLDHLFDYWGYYGFKFNLEDFFSLKYFTSLGRAYVPFHAWEWMIILLYLSYKTGWKSYLTAITLGILSHLIWDTIAVKSFFFYFISYRAFMDFRNFQ